MGKDGEDMSTSGLGERELPSSAEVLTPAQQKQLSSSSFRGPPTEAENRRGDYHASILSGDTRNYAYGMAEAGAFQGPLKAMGAVGHDLGSYVFGKVTGSSAENLESGSADVDFVQHKTCAFNKLKCRQRRAEEEARRAEEEAKRAEEEAKPSKEAVNDKVAEDDGEGSSGKQEETTEDGDTSRSHDSSTEKDKKGAAEDLNRVSMTSTNVSGDITTGGSGHYLPHNDALLRLETLTASETRRLNLALWLWLLVALVFLAYEFIQKLIDSNYGVKNFNRPIINSVLGSCCLVLVSSAIFCHVDRLRKTVKVKKVWKPRRLYVARLLLAELIFQWLNLLFFIIPNFETFGHRCFQAHDTHIAWFALARWTSWNSIFLLSIIQAHNTNPVGTGPAMTSSAGNRGSIGARSLDVDGRRSAGRKSLNIESKAPQHEAAGIDQPFWAFHWPKFVVWGLMEATIITCVGYYSAHGKRTANLQTAINGDVPCADRVFSCRADNTSLILTSMMVLWVLVYFGAYVFYMRRALRMLKERSSQDFRIANIIVRLQLRMRFPAFTFFVLSILLLWFVKPFSCSSFVDTWLGMLPVQLAATGAVLAMAFVSAPKSCNGLYSPILQVWLQEYAWTEEEKPHKVARRNESLPPSSEEYGELEKEPMFCVETMMISLYWSLLAYDYGEVEDSNLSLEEGAAMFDPPLENCELFWDKQPEGPDRGVKVLLAYSKDVILLAFRGTASISNVLTDIQAWRQVHEPKRGKWWNRPQVHKGFQSAWRNNDLNMKVIMRIKAIMKTGDIDCQRVKFYVTGHSLGGAVATLAAYDMRMLGKKYGNDAQVHTYTFGAPRTGNRAFAKDFEEMVPDCWHIINDQDAVARGAKFMGLYKRGGHRVLINPLGDMIVRPAAIEASLRLVPCIPGSVQQHLLTSYLKSMLAVLLAQFSRKRIKGGMSGVVALARNSTPVKRLLMEEAGLSYEKLVYMSRWGGYAERVAQIANLPITGKRTPSHARKLQGDKDTNLRGNFGWCNCCAPIAVRINEAKSGGEHDQDSDANVRDGGSTDSQSAQGKTPIADVDQREVELHNPTEDAMSR